MDGMNEEDSKEDKKRQKKEEQERGKGLVESQKARKYRDVNMKLRGIEIDCCRHT